MNFNDELLAKRIIHSIDDGLELSREDLRKNKPLNNGINFSKVNNIGNAIIEMMRKSYNTDFKIPIVKRGSYKLFGMFHIESKTLITVMSESNVGSKKRRKSKNPHYLDAYTDFNKHFELQPQERQIGMDEWLKYEPEQLKPIKQQMIDELDGVMPVSYYTIVFDMTGLKLTGVRVIMLNEFKEEVNEINWSHLIDVDYTEDYLDETAKKSQDDGLEISIKADKIEKNEDIDITLDKKDKEEKGDVI